MGIVFLWGHKYSFAVLFYIKLSMILVGEHLPQALAMCVCVGGGGGGGGGGARATPGFLSLATRLGLSKHN